MTQRMNAFDQIRARMQALLDDKPIARPVTALPAPHELMGRIQARRAA